MRVSAKLHGATFRVAAVPGGWDCGTVQIFFLNFFLCADIEDDQMMVSEDGNDDNDDDNDTFIA